MLDTDNMSRQIVGSMSAESLVITCKHTTYLFRCGLEHHWRLDHSGKSLYFLNRKHTLFHSVIFRHFSSGSDIYLTASTDGAVLITSSQAADATLSFLQ